MAVDYEKIFSIVRRIPRGRVATYGGIARLARCGPRSVGYALSALGETNPPTPWHRVINAKGQISPRSAGDNHTRQLALLQKEGVKVSAKGNISLREFEWTGDFEDFS